jgi:hypothetical protein
MLIMVMKLNLMVSHFLVVMLAKDLQEITMVKNLKGLTMLTELIVLGLANKISFIMLYPI